MDIELGHLDLNAACFGQPPIAANTAAFDGPADDCIVDKINEFATE